MKSKPTQSQEWFFASTMQAKEKKSRRCNLCSEFFRPKSPHERFCRACRENDERLRYSDWLPELDGELVIRFS